MQSGFNNLGFYSGGFLQTGSDVFVAVEGTRTKIVTKPSQLLMINETKTKEEQTLM